MTDMAFVRLPILGTCLTLLLIAAGCQSKYSNLPIYHPPAMQTVSEAALSEPQAHASVDGVCVPPIGWKIEPLKTSKDHTHQVWLSPTGKTAYGVIHFRLPLPVSAQWV